jgi:hypothetical protein
MATPLNYGKDFGVGKMEAAVSAGIDKIGNIFQDRYNKKQYDDWLQGPAKDYQNTMQEAQDMLLDKTNPDAAQQAVFKIKNATSSYMDAATRFADNPYIMSNAKRVWQGNLDFIKNSMVDPLKKAQAANEQAKADTTQALLPGAPAAQASETNLRNAEADKARAPAGPSKAELKGIVPLLSGDPNQLSQIADPGERADAARANVLAAMNSPRDDSQAKAVGEGIMAEKKSIAMQQVADLSSRGVVREPWQDEKGNTHGGDVWDAKNPDHIKDAMANVDPTLAKEQFVQHTLQAEGPKTGVDPRVVDQKYGVRIDPGRATPTNPITRPLSDDELGKVAFGQDSWSKMQVDPNGQPVMKAVTNIQDVAKILPHSYKNVPPGPFREALDLAVKHLNEAKTNGVKLSVQDVEDVIRGTANSEVVGPLIGGQDTETRDLSEGLRRNRLALGDVSKTMSKKYAQEIAQELGIVKGTPQAKAAPKSKSGIDSILNSVYSTVGGDIKAVGTATGLIKGNQ